MDLEILKKKLSTYRSEGGYLKGVSNELMIEVLLSWEQWTGPAKGFYTALGVNQKSLARLVGNAKKLRREGFPTDGFKELKIVESPSSVGASGGPCVGIELQWKDQQIKFSQVDLLLEFLKKAA